MRRIKNDKENGPQGVRRAKSMAGLPFLHKTLAESNRVSPRELPAQYHPLRPVRIVLPDYFNVPKFYDETLPLGQAKKKMIAIWRIHGESGIQGRLRDLTVLAQGMRRAKNIKQEARCYYAQGVLLQNEGRQESSVRALERFLKIVLFIRDQKSVELGLNAIGVGYMHLNQPKTIEYHRKQGQTGQRPDRFVSHINCGLCYQLMGNVTAAHEEFQNAFNSLGSERDEAKNALLVKLLDRTAGKEQGTFVTENPGKKRFKQAVNIDKRRQKDRVQLGIAQGQLSMGSFMETLKRSFVFEADF